MRKELMLSIVLSIGIVGTALWVAGRSLNAKPHKSVKHLKEGGFSDSELGKAHTAEISEPVNPHTRSTAPATNRALAPASSISKCIINGKTVYSDNGCPDGAKSQVVALHDSAGIVSPPKKNLADLTAKRMNTERAYALQSQSRGAAIGQSGRVECEELVRRIGELDSMARQPHSGVMQDWIKNERKAVRDRQFAIRC